MFDLNKCRVGDKLIDRDGNVCCYVGRDIGSKTTITYPHAVSDRAGTFCYMDDGRFMSTDHKHKWDIVGFAAKLKRVRIRKAKPVNKLAGLCEWLSSIYDVKVQVGGRCIIGTIRNGSKKIGFGYYPHYMGGARAYIYIGYSRDRVCHGVTTLNNFKGAVTKLLKG